MYNVIPGTISRWISHLSKFGNIEQFLIKILGKKDYELFISDVIREHKKKIAMNNYESIIYVYGILVFLIGMDRNAIKKDRFKVKINKGTEIEINIDEFNKRYKRYINRIERYKVELLQEIPSVPININKK